MGYIGHMAPKPRWEIKYLSCLVQPTPPNLYFKIVFQKLCLGPQNPTLTLAHQVELLGQPLSRNVVFGILENKPPPL